MKMSRKFDNIRIGCWVPPMPDGNYGVPCSFINVDRYREAKEFGLDFMIGHMEKGPDSPDVKKALACAAQTGLKYIVRWEDMIHFADLSVEDLKKALGDTIGHEACMGVLIYDEPNADKFPTMGKVADLYRQITDKYFYVNLFPFDAGEELLGTQTYAEHLALFDQYLHNNMVSMDIYPLRKKPHGYYVSDCFLRNLEEIENLCIRKKMEHWQFIQGCMAYGISKSPDYFDMRFQVYVSLCYGATVLQYYCYCTPNIPLMIKKKRWSCMLDYYGNRTHRFYEAQRLNKELHSLGPDYMSFASGWKGVMPVVGSKNTEGGNKAFDMLETPLREYPGISDVQAEQDTIIGVFEGDSGSTAYMVVNYTVPGYRFRDNVKIKFADAKSVTCIRAGKKMPATGGEIDITLGAGEGVFFIVQKK